MGEFLGYAAVEDWAAGCAASLADDLRAILSRKGRATLALAGGTTPAPIYDRLAKEDLDWNGVDVLPTDERWVPEDSADSNARMIRAHLPVGPEDDADFHSLYAPGDTPEIAVGKLSAAMEALLPVDVMLLGMGNDGHTASLFPGSPDLNAALAPDARPLHLIERAEGGPLRVTLSGPALSACRHTHIALRGVEKKNTYEAVSRPGSVETHPARLALPTATVHWVA